MKYLFAVFFVSLSVSCFAQEVVWEQTVTKETIAEFRPEGMGVSASGSIYFTGQYERDTGYFKKIGDNYIRADSSLPDIGVFGSMFIFKLDAEGKLVKQQFTGGVECKVCERGFASVASGTTVTVATDGNILVTGFMKDYRKKNYESDRTQGVFAVMLDSNLEYLWSEVYPSEFNSTPCKVMETRKGNFLIIASSQVKSKYGEEMNSGIRVLKIDNAGKLLADSILRNPPPQRGDNWYPGTFIDGEGTAVVETDDGYLFSGTEEQGGITGKHQALIVETDKHLNTRSKHSYSFFTDKENSSLGFFGGAITLQGDVVGVSGVAQIAHPPCYAAFINRSTYDTLAIVHTEGDVFSYPALVSLGDDRYAMCTNIDYSAVNVQLIEGGKAARKMALNKYKVNEVNGMDARNGYFYILGRHKHGCYIAKIKSSK